MENNQKKLIRLGVVIVTVLVIVGLVWLAGPAIFDAVLRMHGL